MRNAKLKLVDTQDVLDAKTKSEIIGRDAAPQRKLNPPKFQEELIDFHNPHVGWFTSVVQATRDRF